MSGGQHPAFGQKCHMIGEHRRQVQIMHHRDDPSACVGIAARKGHHLQLVADVQTGHRLVQKKPARTLGAGWFPNLCQHAGKLHPLLFAA